jgi:UDP-glucose-4-epimerase GalE
VSRKILVTGGAGYIGSHMVKSLLAHGDEVLVFDNLSTGHRDAVRGAQVVVGDLVRPDEIRAVIREGSFDAVMHFAASCYVGESVREPAKYYVNNVIGTLNLLEAMRAARVGRLVFSSSCATYGNPIRIPIDESHPQFPVNPYGQTKLACEAAMKDYASAYGLGTVALRYFNAAGCDPEGELGERHEPETHLIPLVLAQARRETRGSCTELQVFGDDFDTADGTCVRDYVHVSDLCAAHLLALNRAFGQTGTFEAFNLGTEVGHSVLEVIESCRRVTGARIDYRVAARRQGDPSTLVASAARAREVLGWRPRFGDLDRIVETAWSWLSRQPTDAAQRAHA